jgi:hypothetical protein
MEPTPFEAWQTKLIRHAARHLSRLGWTAEQVATYFGSGTFRDYFENEYSPEAAFAADRTQAYDCVA